MTREEIIEKWTEDFRTLWRNSRTAKMYNQAAADLEKDNIPIGKRINAWTLIYQNMYPDEVFPVNPTALRTEWEEEEEAEIKAQMEGAAVAARQSD